MKSAATAPVEWYARHIAGCLVGFASRVNVITSAGAFERLLKGIKGYMPASAFAARVQAEGIRLGAVNN